MTEEETETLRALVKAKLLEAQKLIETGPTTDELLDKAESLLDDIARAFRTSGIPNKSAKYVRVSRLVAHARLVWNSNHRHLRLAQ